MGGLGDEDGGEGVREVGQIGGAEAREGGIAVCCLNYCVCGCFVRRGGAVGSVVSLGWGAFAGSGEQV